MTRPTLGNSSLKSVPQVGSGKKKKKGGGGRQQRSGNVTLKLLFLSSSEECADINVFWELKAMEEENCFLKRTEQPYVTVCMALCDTSMPCLVRTVPCFVVGYQCKGNFCFVAGTARCQRNPPFPCFLLLVFFFFF